MAGSTTTSKVILITGCSSGLGLELARGALTDGHRVIATSRNPAKTPQLVTEIEGRGGHWLPLDVTSPNLQSEFAAVLAVHGRIDVLINNAGVGIAGAFEDENASRDRMVFETNFFGVLALTRLVLPGMRQQGGGVVVNVSSAVVVFNHPGLSLYAASKWALNGWSESLRAEVAAFGIKVIVAVPGDMRTSFIADAKQTTALTAPSEAYESSAVGYVFQMLRGVNGKQNIDPQRAATRILEAVDGKIDVGLTLPIGSTTVGQMKTWAEGYLDQTQKLEQAAISCDFPGEA